MAVNHTLVLRFADVGAATYASLRVVGDPARTVVWVVAPQAVNSARAELTDALPEPVGAEDQRHALDRAFTRGGFARPATESAIAERLGAQLIDPEAWRLLLDTVSSPRAALFVSPSTRLAQVPWGLLAAPDDSGARLMELCDIYLATPANIAHAARPGAGWSRRRDAAALLLLDPKVPGQRPDSPLGSVLGRPDPDGPLTRHFAGRATATLPEVGDPVELFRRADVDRGWLFAQLARDPSRLLYVGHATAADGDDDGRADRAALHLAEPQPFAAMDLMASRAPTPPRVALLACSSGGDYRFDEASGLVAAMILGGAELVTATLWSLPTTAGHRQYGPAPDADPMADLIIGVDDAHDADHAGRAVNRWQRAAMRRWRDGELTASPLYWASLATFAVGGAR